MVKNVTNNRILLIVHADNEQFAMQYIDQSDCHLTTVCTKDSQALRQCLREVHYWSVIICEYAHNEFFGLNTLLMTKHQCPKTPFIFISTLAGERYAVEAMKQGATDYFAPKDWSALNQAVSDLLAKQDFKHIHEKAPKVDFLTGLLSRNEFNRLLTDLCANGEAKNSVLLYFDIDAFSAVNETCGHEAGDVLLVDVADIIRSHLRKADLIARLGDDEFGAIMVSCSREQALSTGNKIIDAVEDIRFVWNKHVFQVGICIGVVPFDIENISSALLKNANLACAGAKQKGRNHIQIYHAEDEGLQKHDDEVKWVSKIPQALEQERFVLYFQPIVCLKGEDFFHGEVLIRLREAQSGAILSPANFIPAAERYNLMIEVDKYVVSKTLEFFQQYHQMYSQDNNLKKLFFSVNLSGLSLRDGAFLDFLLEKLSLIAGLPHKLCFEITETAAISDASYALYFIKMLKLSGCEIALDDFGSGFASFSYLKTLDVDYLKIDGAFIKNIVTDKMDFSIVEAIVHLCGSTGLKTIAEFTENKEIVALLKDMGVDYAQGYYFSKPLPLPNLQARDVDFSVFETSLTKQT